MMTWPISYSLGNRNSRSEQQINSAMLEEDAMHLGTEADVTADFLDRSKTKKIPQRPSRRHRGVLERDAY